MSADLARPIYTSLFKNWFERDREQVLSLITPDESEQMLFALGLVWSDLSDEQYDMLYKADRKRRAMNDKRMKEDDRRWSGDRKTKFAPLEALRKKNGW